MDSRTGLMLSLQPMDQVSHSYGPAGTNVPEFWRGSAEAALSLPNGLAPGNLWGS